MAAPSMTPGMDVLLIGAIRCTPEIAPPLVATGSLSVKGNHRQKIPGWTGSVPAISALKLSGSVYPCGEDHNLDQSYDILPHRGCFDAVVGTLQFLGFVFCK